MKLCQADTCNNPVWGKGFCKNHQYLRPDFDNRTILQKGIAKAVIQKQLSSLKKLPENKEAAKKYIRKRSLLKYGALSVETIRRNDPLSMADTVRFQTKIRNVGLNTKLHASV